jgi:hypothetical protein
LCVINYYPIRYCFYIEIIIIIMISAPTGYTIYRTSPPLSFADGAPFGLLAPKLVALLWLPPEGDAAWVCPVGDWDGAEPPGNKVAGAANEVAAVMSLKDDDAAAEPVAMTVKTVVTIYVVKDSTSYM